MPDFAYYQGYLQAGLKEVERYLLSDQLFWPLIISSDSGEPSYPNLTLGGLRLYQKYARPLAQTISQKTVLQQIETEIEVTQTHWRVAWERKASWEFESRLRQWGNFIKEMRVDPEDHLGYYRYEVRFRVILDLLMSDLNDVDPAQIEHLEGLDTLLRALFSLGDFIWEPELAAEFPEDRFWYLWGVLKEP
jgi:hypothetical protein